uniref:C-Jun-amino-terminal kinase-interacting protein 4 n=1 Tax=Ciona intestinalis TaxID=7719 RepID=UPI000EF4E394|nr:C-Jun-amino-terminal kinase-interacting protein 4 [Ciona intestinalis]|eukprot:XP_026696466.1 C-Jun-amino-terminal kinase-interacting protein 4 [Ciona intestinalis]
MYQESEILYSSDQDINNGLNSEKLPSPELPVQVQAMANSVYGEFKRMMGTYGEEVIKELMPLIVTILETLDRSLSECNANAVEVEMLKDDNEQLATQYERERQLRRHAEQQLMESEDVNEAATREIRAKADALETATRHLELKCKNYTDQVERLQEREADLKREYTILHERHTEMIQSYMEHIEKTKVLQQQSSYNEFSQSPNNYLPWYRKEFPRSVATPSPSGSSEFPPFSASDNNQNVVLTPIATRPDYASTPNAERSNISIKDEIPKSLPITPSTPSSSEDKSSQPTSNEEQPPHEVMVGKKKLTNQTQTPQAQVPARAVKKLHEKSLHQMTMTKQTISQAANLYKEQVTCVGSKVQQTTEPTETDALDLNVALINETVRHEVQGVAKESIGQDVGSPSGESEGAGWVSDEVKVMLQNGEFDLENTPLDGSGDYTSDKPELESTGIENAAFETTVNESSLYAELSKQDLGDVDEGADILDMYEPNNPFSGCLVQDNNFTEYSGMSKEVENLLHENTKLLATKNALNVVKDDLIQQVDQLTTQHTILKEELVASEKAKEDLQKRLAEFEKQLAKLQHELDNVGKDGTRNSTSKQSDEEEALPLSQRKRFTRVEMARVLMERNQYKERLMELQEAVRWTETLRASRNHPEVAQPKIKSKSNIFNFFSRLFTSNSSEPAPSPPQPVPSQLEPYLGRHGRRSISSSNDLNIQMSYNAPTSKVMPRSKSSSMSLYGRSPTIDTLREEVDRRLPHLKHEAATKSRFSMWLTSGTRDTTKYQPRVNDTARFQACGWSLPNSPASPKEGSRTVPVPVYCGPMVDTNSNMKIWCATAVNIADGRTRDGGSIVGTSSIFYDGKELDTVKEREETEQSEENGDQNDVVDLEEELETQTQSFKFDEKRRGALSSLVWIISGDTRSSNGVFGGSKVSVMDAREPNKYLDQFSIGSNDTHVLCVTSVPGALEEDYSLSDSLEVDSMYSSAGDSSMLGMTQSPTELGSQFPTSSSSQEVGVEATEDLVSSDATNLVRVEGQKKFLNEEKNDTSPVSSSPKIGGIEKIKTPTIENPVNDGDTDESPTKCDNSSPDGTRLASLQPTVWMGAQNGYVYVHSAISNWRRCLHQIRLKDSVLSIVHLKGRALAALADGTVAIFRRDTDGVWDLSSYYLLDLGRPHHSIRCMSVVYDHVWCGYRNRIHIVEPKTMKVVKSFDAHPRRESQVRQLAWAGDGVWVSIRLDSTVRLYHARTLQHLQDVDIEPYVSKVLGSGKLGFSFVRITALMISQNRLWIGTGNGVVMSVPLSEGAKSNQASSAVLSSSRASDRPGGVVRVYKDPLSDKITPGTFIPYCSMANAQLSFHGYRDAVKFFVAVRGCVTQPNTANGSVGLSPPKQPDNSDPGTLVLSGGEGYVDFRKGDLVAISPEDMKASNSGIQSTTQMSHVIVWQLTHQ